jgi:hypothetical protein
MLDVEDIIDELSVYYDELDGDSFVAEPYLDAVPDLRVEFANIVFVFKVYSDILDLEDARGEWTLFDETYREWWLCLPEGLTEDAEELIEELELENVSICVWEEMEDGIQFLSVPDPEDG